MSQTLGVCLDMLIQKGLSGLNFVWTKQWFKRLFVGGQGIYFLPADVK